MTGKTGSDVASSVNRAYLADHRRGRIRLFLFLLILDELQALGMLKGRVEQAEVVQHLQLVQGRICGECREELGGRLKSIQKRYSEGEWAHHRWYQ